MTILGSLITLVLVICCTCSSLLAQLGGQYVTLSYQQGYKNTTLTAMSVPNFAIQSSQPSFIKNNENAIPNSVNRKDNLIYVHADSAMYGIDRKTLNVKQLFGFNQNIVNMEYNPKGDNLIALIDVHRYIIASISPNGKMNSIMDLDRMLNQSFTPSTMGSNSAYDFNRNVFYLSVNDGAWIPGHNRILKFDLKNEKVSALVFENQFSEYGDLDYDPTIDMIIGIYYPVSSDNSVEFFTLDPSTAKFEKFSIPGIGLSSNHVNSYSSLNGYYYILTETGKTFIIDVKARKLVLSTSNPISSNFNFLFGYCF